MMTKFIGGEQSGDKLSTEVRPEDYSTGFSSVFKAWRDSVKDILTTDATRSDKYDQYLYLDRNLAEATASLNIYADNVVSGTVDGDDSYYVYVDEENQDIAELEKIIEDVEAKTKIKDQIWDISRDLIRDGDVFREVVIEKEDGQLSISKLKSLPTKEIKANVDDRGAFKDEKIPYFQVTDDSKDPIQFDWWRIIHFKIGSDVYGVDRSLFANSSLRIGRQLIWVNECLVLARLSRAWQRNAYMIDVGKLSGQDAFDHVRKFMNNMKTKKVIANSTTGRTSIIDNPPLPDEDIGIPVGENSKADVKTISGDTNIGNIDDVKYLQNGFLIATTTPKAYISLEEGVNGKATLGQIDVQFARQVRRRQQSLIPGLRAFYWLAFKLAGKDPDAFKWSIVFPELATTDEMLKWEMVRIKAEIARVLVVDVGVVNNEWVLRELLGFDDEEVGKYQAIAPVDSQDTVQLPPELASMVRRDPEIRAMLYDFRDVVKGRARREEELRNKRPLGIAREDHVRS
jgi:hypothetical protein